MKAVVATLVLVAATLAMGFRDMNEAVTLSARPAVAAADAPITLSGAISVPKAGELVTVQVKERGIATGFRAVAGAQTTATGAWTVDYRPRSTTGLRAVWGSEQSSPDVTVKQRAGVQLVARPGRTFRVSVYGIVPLDGKRVTIERFDRARRVWRKVQTVVVHSESYGEYAEKTGVRIRVPQGTAAVLGFFPWRKRSPATSPASPRSSDRRRGGDVSEARGSIGSERRRGARDAPPGECRDGRPWEGRRDPPRDRRARMRGARAVRGRPWNGEDGARPCDRRRRRRSDFPRIQCTPDLQPTDVTGLSVFNQATRDFEFRPGPVFANVLLVDEINRAMPKTQSALLEAMAERQVTTDGETQILPAPFLLLATENPIEQEGTFPLRKRSSTASSSEPRSAIRARTTSCASSSSSGAPPAPRHLRPSRHARGGERDPRGGDRTSTSTS